MSNILFKSQMLVIVITTFAITLCAHSQSKVEEILSEVQRNNKSLAANNQLMESRKLESNVGISLSNPFIEVTHLFGSSGEPGDQTEFKIIQAFDFPTAYSKRNKISDLKNQQTAFENEILRQDILLEAKLICIELIYLNKLIAQLKQRTESTESLYSLYETRLIRGEGNILDVNKAKITLLNTSTDLVMIQSRIDRLNEKLTELNGGIAISVSDTIYPVTPVIPEFVTLENEIEINDPLRKSLVQEKLISQGQIELSKTLSLPKFELGYYYLGLPRQNYNGFHFGISIPLWENNYRTDYHRSKTLYTDLEIESHKNEHFFEIKQQYNRYVTLRDALNEYKGILDASDSEEILNRALNIGELSAINYFLEVSYYYTSYDKYLELEYEYQKVIAELLKYRL